ncbi:class I adenylate-forming enzyme family protein [Massilia niabensis]|uniref:Class I adenylate-forming enzyme family protein n=1 Tax=Massilia niabensis TaxID=544910 RepID=A0ABW0L1P5_9BURK
MDRHDWCEVSPIGDLLVKGAVFHPERDAIVFPDTRSTYGALLDGAVAVARALLALDVKPGEHVGLMAANGLAFVEAFFGIAMLGCVAVPLHARHKAGELAYIIENADLVAVLTTAEASDHVEFMALFRAALPSLAMAADPARLALPEAPRLRNILLLRGDAAPGCIGHLDLQRHASATDAARVHAARQQVRIRDTGAILYTSGTTNHPKGCLLSHEALVRGAVQRARRRFRHAGHGVTWGAGPLFHIGSLAPMLGAIGSGGTYVTDTIFDAGRALALIQRERADTVFPWFPAIVRALLDHPDFNPARLPALRSFVTIGPAALIERIQCLLPQAELIQACGMTETAGIYAITGASDTARERTHSNGKPAPGIEVSIRDLDTGAPAAPGTVGEILVRGYCVTEGYYRDPVKTTQAIDGARWLHTGDLYLQDSDGNLVFHGRLKDMLKVGGENVAAIEVESLLCAHPAVKAAEVVGMPDERLDEVAAAFIEVKQGATLTAEQLIAFCKGRIASFKIPRAVLFISAEQWPMSATKVDKRVLRTRLAAALAEK